MSAAIVSIACFWSCSPDSLAAQYGLLSESEIKELIGIGAVGDMLGKIFNKKGRACGEQSLPSRTQHSLESIREGDLVLRDAGQKKRDALRAVLQSGTVNRLIGDGNLALSVLDD